MSPKTPHWGADWSRLPVRVLGDWVIPGLPGLPLADRIRICTRCERRSVTNRPAWRQDPVCEVCAHVLALGDLPYDLCVEVMAQAFAALPQRSRWQLAAHLGRLISNGGINE